MNKSDHINNDLSALQNDFKDLRNDVNTFLKNMKDSQKHKSNEIIHEISEEGKKAFDAVFPKPKNQIINELQKHPIISTFALLAIGFLSVRTFLK